jgi:hypothetical protein
VHVSGLGEGSIHSQMWALWAASIAGRARRCGRKKGANFVIAGSLYTQRHRAQRPQRPRNGWSEAAPWAPLYAALDPRISLLCHRYSRPMGLEPAYLKASHPRSLSDRGLTNTST